MEASDSLKRAIETGDEDLVLEALEVLVKDAGLDQPDGWINGCVKLMTGTLMGAITWPNVVIDRAELDSVDDRIRAAIELAATMSKAGRRSIRKNLTTDADWIKPFDRLSWDDRNQVVYFIDNDVDLDSKVKTEMCRGASQFVGSAGNAFHELQLLTDLLDASEIGVKLDTFERALEAYRAGTLFTKAVGEGDQHSFLHSALATFAASGDDANFENAFDYCVAFELGRRKLEAAVVTAGMYRDRLPIKAALVEAIAASYSGDQGSHARATKYLLDEFDRCPPQVTDRWLLLEEARIHAGNDDGLVDQINRRWIQSGQVRELPRLAGQIVVVGGEGDMKSKLKRAFAREELEEVKFEHMTANAAKNQGQRLKQLVKGSDGVLIYWWVSSHAASEKARSEADAAGVKWMYSSLPGCAGFVADVAELLGKS
jgi:hypothetical protein